MFRNNRERERKSNCDLNWDVPISLYVSYSRIFSRHSPISACQQLDLGMSRSKFTYCNDLSIFCSGFRSLVVMQLSGDRHKPRHKPRCMERWAHSTGFYWLQLIPWRIDSMNFFVAPIFDGFLQRFGVGWARRMHQRLYKSVRRPAAETPNSLVQFDGHGAMDPRRSWKDRHRQVMCHIVTSYWTLGSSMFMFGNKKTTGSWLLSLVILSLLKRPPPNSMVNTVIHFYY